jgi:HK97 family phage portal protein
MALKNIFTGIKNKSKKLAYAKMLNGYTPVFSQFGNDIYASDIVNTCIRSIAEEMSKLTPRHIRRNGDSQEEVKSSINRLLKFAPNEFMTTKEFLEKITWLYEKNYNCFIYPKYDVIEHNGTIKRNYTGFYPLNPTEVDFLQDENGEMFIKFYFLNGENYTLPYNDIIHWRKDFSDSDLMGGDSEGRPKNEDILKVLKINHVLTDGLEKAIKSSLAVRGIVKINTMMDDEKQKAEREAFEKRMTESKSGIMVLDLKSEYMPISVDPKLIDKDTLEFIERKILNHYGVSRAIVNGDFNDEQYQAFYEKKLEVNIIALGQAFSKTLFSSNQLDHGNEVIFYGQKLLFTNTKNKIAVADILASRGALTDNQLLELFGYPPFEGGDVRHMSLNFINRDIADQYQLNNFKKDKGVKQDE